MQKNWIIGVTIIATLLIAGAAAWILSNDGLSNKISVTENDENNPSIPNNSTTPEIEEINSPSIPWERIIDHPATNLVVQDGKVFLTDKEGIISCYYTQNGELLWNNTIGTSIGHGIVISENCIYVTLDKGRVSCLDKNNGTILWEIQKVADLNTVPTVIVEDELLTVIADDISIHNATTGKRITEFKSFLEHFEGSDRNKYPMGGNSLNGRYIYAIAGDYSKIHFYKIRWTNGDVIWRSDVTWDGSIAALGQGIAFAPFVVTEVERKIIIAVLFQGTTPVNQFISLSASSGKELWTAEAGTTEGRNPFVAGVKVYDDFLFFIKGDGYMNAINLENGTIAWRTKVDTQELFNFNCFWNNTIKTSGIEIDEKNQRLFWYLNGAKSTPSNNYTGTLCNINIADGSVNWIRHLENENGSFGSFMWGNCVDLTYNEENDKLFLAKNQGLWIFNATTSGLIQTKQFNDYVSPPVNSENDVFVVGDLQLLAYD